MSRRSRRASPLAIDPLGKPSSPLLMTASKAGITTVEQTTFKVPELSIKDLLDAIPAHCFQRSTLRSLSYVAMDFGIIAGIYKATTHAETFLTPELLPNPYAMTAAKFALWAGYSFFTGLFATGIWVVAHECGHQAFSESKMVNNVVGWVLHSGLGVPYHSWRITHAKHHASTGHMTQDQVFVPRTRSQRGLPALDSTGENLQGSSVTDKVKEELWDAIGDSPIGAAFGAASYLLAGWPAYIIRNASGQLRYPKGTSHFNPHSPMFAPHHYGQVLISDLGIVLWLAGIVAGIHQFGFLTVFKTYLVPYLWVNHWLVLITFLQHTDPLLPHYRPPQFTFPRGALATMDRNLLGGGGPLMGWLGAFATHGISETHVLHHVSSKIPHYHAWEATYALRKRLEKDGIINIGAPGGWGEVYRVYKECKFVEDEGDVVFYKNALGLAQVRPAASDEGSASDSGIEITDSKRK